MAWKGEEDTTEEGSGAISSQSIRFEVLPEPRQKYYSGLQGHWLRRSQALPLQKDTRPGDRPGES